MLAPLSGLTIDLISNQCYTDINTDPFMYSLTIDIHVLIIITLQLCHVTLTIGLKIPMYNLFILIPLTYFPL